MKTILLLLLLAVTIQAQMPVKERFRPFSASDAAYWGGASLDLASSIDKREANPLWRDSQGLFSPGKNLAFKGALWGAMKGLEYHFSSPKERRILSWAKIAIGATFAGFAARNFTIKRAR